MSKSLNLFLPAFGGTALALGVAYGVMSRDYGEQHIESLEIQVQQARDAAAGAAAAARESDVEIDRLTAEAAELLAAVASGGGLTEPAPVSDTRFDLGRTALPEEIAAWDVDVLPDGRGLPEGRGDVWTGEEVFVEKCASCHGDFAEGSGNWPVLAGGFGTLADEDPVKTVGSYWPYLSTTWDYVNRSMPFGDAGTLGPDETYAIVAYILYSNDLVDEDFELSHETFLDVDMPNADGFVLDDRPEREYAQWRVEPCMSDCKDSVEITMRASVVDVTPEDDSDADAAAEPVAAEPAQETAAAADAGGVDPALIAAGEGAFRQCMACHQVGPDATNRSGPQLNGIVGRTIGSVDGFRYSNTFMDAGEAGESWTVEALSTFFADPRGARPGTKMSFRGVRDEEDIAAIIAYLESIGAP